MWHGRFGMSYPVLPDDVDLSMAVPPRGNAFPLLPRLPERPPSPPVPERQLFFSFPIPEVCAAYGTRQPAVQLTPPLPSRQRKRGRAIGRCNPIVSSMRASRDSLVRTSPAPSLFVPEQPPELIESAGLDGAHDIIASAQTVIEDNGDVAVDGPSVGQVPVGDLPMIDATPASSLVATPIPIRTVQATDSEWELRDFSYEGLLQLGSLAVKGGLTLDQMRRLPSFVATKSAPISEGDDCCICLEAFDVGCKWTRVNCGHVFHYKCAMVALKQLALCPLCRHPVG